MTPIPSGTPPHSALRTPHSALSPHALLHRQYRWMRAGLALCFTADGLLLTLIALWFTHPSPAPWQNWGPIALLWIAGLALSFSTGLALWLLRRWSLRETARRVDERLQSRNRLETAAQFSHINDPLLAAQRLETAAYLGSTPVHRRLERFPWLIVTLWLLLIAHAATWLAWARPWVHPAIAAIPAAIPQASPTPAPLPQASIRWVSPRSETLAAPIEEVPLEATADSAAPLGDLSLQVSVNGLPQPGIPIPMPELAKAGVHKIDTSIYLDELKVQPYDMVSYYLQAHRVTSRPNVPATFSPVQFVQVKPFRDDIREDSAAAEAAMTQQQQQSLHLAQAMKVAQLRLIKENFTLAHAEITHDQPEWQQENKRVGAEQGLLETKAAQILQQMIQEGAPANMVDLISQAKPLIGDAAKKIVAGQNDPALPVQGKALAAITAIEKYLIHVASQSRQTAARQQQQQQVNDPFQRQRDVELKQRSQTQAGELELLAREQSRLAQDLAQNNTAPDSPPPGAPPDINRITGTPGERQTQISQRLGALLNGQNFDPDTTDHLQKGRDQAQESLRQLDADDPANAREPAATAAQELQLAADAMDRAGQQKAQQQLDAALLAMNQAAGQARNAPAQPSPQAARAAAAQAARQAEQVRAALAAAAWQQQSTGSEAAAARMAALANALNAPNLHDQLQKLQAQPRDPATAETAARHLDQLATQMAPQPAPGGPTREQLTALIERMQRAQVNLARLAQQPGIPPLNPQPAQPPQPHPGNPLQQTPSEAAPTVQPSTSPHPPQSTSPAPTGTLGHLGPLSPLSPQVLQVLQVLQVPSPPRSPPPPPPISPNPSSTNSPKTPTPAPTTSPTPRSSPAPAPKSAPPSPPCAAGPSSPPSPKPTAVCATPLAASSTSSASSSPNPPVKSNSPPGKPTRPLPPTVPP